MKICIPYASGTVGGPTTFFHKFSRALAARHIETTPTWSDDCDLLLAIIYAHPAVLWRAKRRKAPIVQRLDGLYYPAIARYRWLRLNLPIWINYRFFSDHVIFQSCYCRLQCEHFIGNPRRLASIVYNGVDLSAFVPRESAGWQSGAPVSLLCALSTFNRSSELLPVLYAYRQLREQHNAVDLTVVGELGSTVQAIPQQWSDVNWVGTISNEEMADLYRASTLMLSSKLRAPCPNIVIEAMASGLPVVCYDSGSHRELIGDEAGICVPLEDGFGAFPELDSTSLARAAEQVLAHREQYATGARERAVRLFDLEHMVDRYIAVFDAALGRK